MQPGVYQSITRRPLMEMLAFDIGGANIKAAHQHGDVWTRPFALWKHPHELVNQLKKLAQSAPPFDQLAITMTGELCDCFPTKRDGVAHILNAIEQLARNRPVHVWQVDGCFVDPATACANPSLCSSANWHALATFIAHDYTKDLGLLIDTGSTTTDIVPFQDGQLACIGLSDTDRLTTGGLVYVGSERTSLMALGPDVNWRGKRCRLMAEHFATIADAILLADDAILERPDDHDTADGKPMTRHFATTRLLRIIGADTEMTDHVQTSKLATQFVDQAIKRITSSIKQVLPDHSPTRIIISGSGESLAHAAAKTVFPQTPIARLSDHIGPEASRAACAHALLQLHQFHFSTEPDPFATERLA